MNRSFPLSLAALALVLAANPAFAVEAPKPKPPERPPFEVAKPIENENFWVGVFGPTNCSWIDTGDGVLVIDTGATAADAKNLKAEIARTTKNKPIKWIAMTHLHSDSNNGFTTFLPTDATIIVNARATGAVADSSRRERRRLRTSSGSATASRSWPASGLSRSACRPETRTPRSTSTSSTFRRGPSSRAIS